MEFRNLPEFKDLINSEGPILSIVESIDDDDAVNERLYLKARCLKGKGTLYAKVNNAALEMFFQGRLTVKELYLLRVDEFYVIEYNGRQDVVLLDTAFETRVIETVSCKDSVYYALSEDMRLEDPFKEVLKLVNFYYINGLGTHCSDITIGLKWVRDNL